MPQYHERYLNALFLVRCMIIRNSVKEMQKLIDMVWCSHCQCD